MVSLPDLTIDMDGVLCRPVSWFNLVISRDVRNAPDLVAPARPRQGLSHRVWGTGLGQSLRYAWRPPLPLVREGLAELAELRRLVLLSGRSHTAYRSTERWLIRHGLRDFFSELVLNDRGVPNATFKLLVAGERQVREHVDDDGRVAYFLAQDPARTVYLVSWRGNQGLAYPPTVRRVQNLREAAREIRRVAAVVLERPPGLRSGRIRRRVGNGRIVRVLPGSWLRVVARQLFLDDDPEQSVAFLDHRLAPGTGVSDRFRFDDELLTAVRADPRLDAHQSASGRRPGHGQARLAPRSAAPQKWCQMES